MAGESGSPKHCSSPQVSSQYDPTLLAARPPQLAVPHPPEQDDAQREQEGGRAAPDSIPDRGAKLTETGKRILSCN